MSAHEPVVVEADQPNLLAITGAVIACIVLVLGIVIGVTEYFGFAIRDERQAKVLAPESTQLREQRARDQQRLTRYQWVDKEQGIVRLPLDRARELTLRDWGSRPTGVVALGGGPLEAAEEAPEQETQTEGAPEEGAAPTTEEPAGD